MRQFENPMPMKILHILDVSLPHRQSGYSLRSQYIINTQKALGFDPVVLTRWGVSEELTDDVEYINDVPYLRNNSKKYCDTYGQISITRYPTNLSRGSDAKLS
ncbi:MAG: hypothetical protein OXH16_23820 [Gemmatimonadetes bacterium]|nr:hypothetical protein [Gemmatimonadota bacterium]